MATCPNCGAGLERNRLTCSACGADVPLWLARGQEIFGPYRLADLQQAQAEGRLAAEDQVSAGSGGEWQPLNSFLAGVGGKAVLPPLPPAFAGPPPVVRRKSDQLMPVVFTLFGFMLLAFLAIVAAIIIPVFAKSREKAQQASCMSNLKQISLAMLQYSQDYDERFPPLVSALDPPNYGFIRNRTLDLSREFPPWNWRVIYSPYLRNSQLYLCPSTFDKYSYRLNAALDGKLLGQIRRPAETPGVYDIGWLGGEPPPPHNDGYNVGYVDGHVKWMHGSVEALPGR